jgi:hypothetical protein
MLSELNQIHNIVIYSLLVLIECELLQRFQTRQSIEKKMFSNDSRMAVLLKGQKSNVCVSNIQKKANQNPVILVSVNPKFFSESSICHNRRLVHRVLQQDHSTIGAFVR